MARGSNRRFVGAAVSFAAVVGVAVIVWGAWALAHPSSPVRGSGEATSSSPEVEPAPEPDSESDEETAGDGEKDEAADDATGAEDSPDAEVAAVVERMTLEEKVAQLFVVRPEDITKVGTQTAAGEATRQALERWPVGGICYFAKNLTDPAQTRSMLANTQAYYEEITGLPCFLAVDEEGGTVARVGANRAYGVPWVGNMADCASVEDARAKAETIAGYLTDLGFNLDFAPDADIASVEGSSLAKRSFGATADEVTPKVKAQVEAFLERGLLCSAKHFPGIGGAVGDSHEGAITVTSTLDELRESELLPFGGAIEAGVPFVMVGHLSVPNVTGNDVAASLNPVIIQDLLRDELGFEGIVITDSLGMGAVVGNYGYDEIGVAALEAGVDMILMPADFEACYQGVLDAVHEGRLTEERIDESVSRIVAAKLELLG